MKKLLPFIIFFLIIPFAYNFYHMHNNKPLFSSKILDETGPVSNGIKYFELYFKIDNTDVLVTLFNIDTQKAPIDITSPEIIEKKNANTKYSGYTLEEYFSTSAYKIVQSGGFLSSWNPPSPLGYVKIQGKEFSKTHQSWLTKGVFCTNGKDFEISTFKSIEQFKEWPSCIQGGPIIIQNHKIVLEKGRNAGYVTKERHRQSFICKNAENHLLMGIAEAVKLESLAERLALSENDGGLGCTDALLLTSKGISGIYTNIPHAKPVGNTKVPLPNAIVVRSVSEHN